MPRYLKSKKGELQKAKRKFKNFTSYAQISRFLSRVDDKTWEVYRRLAKDYLDGRKNS